MPGFEPNLRGYIRQRRQELNKTQRQVAATCGVTPDYIALIEGGLRRPDLERIPLLADALEVSRVELCRQALADRAPQLYQELFPAA